MVKDNHDLSTYLSVFDYEERIRMKIRIPELLDLLKKGEVQFIDIRFREEYQAWHFGFAKNIPLNELPNRLGELDRTKPVVTACPHYDRSIMARLFLVSRGFQARYLVEGLLGLADYLRGDAARDFVTALSEE